MTQPKGFFKGNSPSPYKSKTNQKINIIDIWELEEETDDLAETNILSSMTSYYSGSEDDDMKTPIITFEGNPDFLKTKKLEFDLNNKFIMCYS